MPEGPLSGAPFLEPCISFLVLIAVSGMVRERISSLMYSRGVRYTCFGFKDQGDEWSWVILFDAGSSLDMSN